METIAFTSSSPVGCRVGLDHDRLLGDRLLPWRCLVNGPVLTFCSPGSWVAKFPFGCGKRHPRSISAGRGMPARSSQRGRKTPSTLQPTSNKRSRPLRPATQISRLHFYYIRKRYSKVYRVSPFVSTAAPSNQWPTKENGRSARRGIDDPLV